MRQPHTRHAAAQPGDPSQRLHAAQIAAAEARETLEHPGLRAAFGRLRTHYIEQMTRLPPADREGREGAYLMLRALDALADDLVRTIKAPDVITHNYRSILRTEEEVIP